MAMLGAERRLVRFEITVRLRRFGYWPWAMLVGWSLLAAGQEPRLLRDFGIQLAWQGTWFGAAVLLVALACSGVQGHQTGGAGSNGVVLRSGAITSAVAGFGLVAAVGVSQALLAWITDLISGDVPPFGLATRSAVGFVLAMTPASVAGICLAPLWAGSMVAKLCLGLAVGFSLSASAVSFHDPNLTAATASVLAAIGAVGASAWIASPASVTRTPPPHAHRHPR